MIFLNDLPFAFTIWLAIEGASKVIVDDVVTDAGEWHYEQ